MQSHEPHRDVNTPLCEISQSIYLMYIWSFVALMLHSRMVRSQRDSIEPGNNESHGPVNKSMQIHN